MKVILCAINSSYVHKNLAILKMEKYFDFPVVLKEYTINQTLNSIYSDLILEKADVYCFSSYIWNIELLIKLSEMIKKALGAIVVFGGPEAGGDPIEYSKNAYIDYVIKGEGERSLSLLLNNINDKKEGEIEGVYKDGVGQGVAEREVNVPMPYEEKDLKNSENRIIYYEASRGCFNKCSYCVSSNEDCLLYDIEKVKKEIKFLCDNGIKDLKFVDRSFNGYKGRSEELFRFLSEETGETSFHCEIAPDLLSEKMLEIIKNAPSGKFRFEAGIQSTNENTLRAVKRKCDNKKAFENIKKLISFKNCSVHTDIIAGLPLEDKESFKKSFDEVYSLLADQMELGFLKVLKGTDIKKDAEKYGIVYQSFAPYEVIKTECLSVLDLIDIKKAKLALTRLYNSKKFTYTVKKLENEASSFYDMYEEIGECLNEAMSLNKVFSVLLKKYPHLHKELIMDFMLTGEKSTPEGISEKEIPHFSEKCISYLSENCEKYFPELKGMHPAKCFKHLKFRSFEEGVFVSGRDIKRVYHLTDFT